MEQSKQRIEIKHNWRIINVFETTKSRRHVIMYHLGGQDECIVQCKPASQSLLVES